VAEQRQGDQGPLVVGKFRGQLAVGGDRRRRQAAFVLQFGQQQAQPEGLGLQRRAHGLLVGGLHLRFGLSASALLQLQQGHQLQRLHLIAAAVEDHAQLPLRSGPVAPLATQLRQHQPQRPALRFTVGQRLQQADRLLAAIERHQQLEQALLLLRCGLAAIQPLAQRLHLLLQLGAAGGGAAGRGALAAAQPPAGAGGTGQQRQHQQERPQAGTPRIRCRHLTAVIRCRPPGKGDMPGPEATATTGYIGPAAGCRPCPAGRAHPNLLMRQHPISPVTEPMQYRAIGVVRGQYVPTDAEHPTRGLIRTCEGEEIEAVVLGRLLTLMRRHLDAEQPHLWVVYPRSREQDRLHLQMVGVWEPSSLDPDAAASGASDTLPEGDDYFSIRGELIYTRPESGDLVIKVRQQPRADGSRPLPFKLQLRGAIPLEHLRHFVSLAVRRQGQALGVEAFEVIGPLAQRGNRGGKRRRDGNEAGPRRERRAEPQATGAAGQRRETGEASRASVRSRAISRPSR